MLTQAKLKSILFYDPETGLFVWLIRASSRIHAGTIAGCLRNGYVTITINGIDYYAHQLAWLYVYGVFAPRLDHRNTHRHDNRIDNLREATHAQNRWNTGLQKNNTTGYRGVSYDKTSGKYSASIMVNKTKLYLGLFVLPEDASIAYEQASIEHFGDFKRK